ncbi:SIR2 family NAD-dependent protein deacylase [Hippea maritima]|uniref:NAD-dependent protein deacylase n=1 Tax=Hippea maritima (strain ATCC 700847 / DSM 10411 / MH2) TaxID=760142 RepID=F2LUD8_HIPMA|nr:NAD-dependent deacylase [Hippea maritima]AEA33464.1 NAD-dependent deacetylase [Hippea maritima DSM 10411]
MIERIKKAADKIKKAKRITILTGAGISKASGIPTFRGEDGLWGKYSISEFATLEAFHKDPKKVWQWYNYRKKLIKQAEPNKAHYVLVELERIFKDGFALITQNIDNLHTKAGNKSVYELHGNIFEVKCLICNKIYHDQTIYKDDQLPPKCKYCQSIRTRPNVVWFGESLDVELIKKAMALAASCDVFISVGTSGGVQPAAGLPKIAQRMGKYVVEFNAEYSAISMFADDVIIGNAEKTLPMLLNYLTR